MNSIHSAGLPAVVLAVFVASTPIGVTNATEIAVFTSRAISTVLSVIGPEFEQTSGHKLNVISGFSPNFVKQINAGEPFDLIISPPRTIEGLGSRLIKSPMQNLGEMVKNTKKFASIFMRCVVESQAKQVGLFLSFSRSPCSDGKTDRFMSFDPSKEWQGAS